MTIETKFNIEDTVWCMVDNKPTEVVITGFLVVKPNHDANIIIQYDFDKAPDTVNEDQMFYKKEDLLKSL